MKKLSVVLVLILAGYFTIINCNGAGDEFVNLFNGQDLSGWVNVNCAPETFTVKDGMIVCTGIPTGVMRTDKMYENFILELEWKHTQQGGNAGLFIYSDAITAPGKPFTRSVEVQIMDGDNGDMFAIHGATLTPRVVNPKGMRSSPWEERNHPAGQWNKYVVESQDGVLTLSVNGKVVNRVFHCNPRKGYICLESEGSLIYFRNIRIKELPSTNPHPLTVAKADEGFKCLYNGLDLRGWKIDPQSTGWQPDNWKLNYDGGQKDVKFDQNLWTEKDYGDFQLIVDWRQTMDIWEDKVQVILPDGSYLLDDKGAEVLVPIRDAGDSGIYLRGESKSQINIWNWPVGSGEIWGYRLDKEMPAEVRAGATPIQAADKAPGEWNRFEITCKGDRVTVLLNGKLVIDNAQLPGLPAKGPVALQHHTDPMQFANIYIKEL